MLDNLPEALMKKMSKTTPGRKVDDAAQSHAHIKKARKIEADEEGSAPDELLGRLAHKKPEPYKKGGHAGRSLRREQQADVRVPHSGGRQGGFLIGLAI